MSLASFCIGCYSDVGIEKFGPSDCSLDHRAVTVFIRVKNLTPSGPCMLSGPKIDRFQPPNE